MLTYKDKPKTDRPTRTSPYLSRMRLDHGSDRAPTWPCACTRVLCHTAYHTPLFRPSTLRWWATAPPRVSPPTMPAQPTAAGTVGAHEAAPEAAFCDGRWGSTHPRPPPRHRCAQSMWKHAATHMSLCGDNTNNAWISHIPLNDRTWVRLQGVGVQRPVRKTPPLQTPGS